ncbi:hypothetical protein C8R47DRAFT_1224769 [Mycena vitilis]|nr:hypothetical protein C8R47DRAFT_1224769 [Mycena vitilis]
MSRRADGRCSSPAIQQKTPVRGSHASTIPVSQADSRACVRGFLCETSMVWGWLDHHTYRDDGPLPGSEVRTRTRGEHAKRTRAGYSMQRTPSLQEPCTAVPESHVRRGVKTQHGPADQTTAASRVRKTPDSSKPAPRRGHRRRSHRTPLPSAPNALTVAGTCAAARCTAAAALIRVRAHDAGAWFWIRARQTMGGRDTSRRRAPRRRQPLWLAVMPLHAAAARESDKIRLVTIHSLVRTRPSYSTPLSRAPMRCPMPHPA